MSGQTRDQKAAARASAGAGDERSFDIVAETERLLSGRKRDLRLTGQMLELYRLNSWQQRSAIVRAWMVWVAGISIIMTVINALLIPQALWQGAMIAALVVPGLNIVVHWLWRKPGSGAVEGLSIVFWMCGLLVAFASIGVVAGEYHGERYATGALFVCTIGLLVLGIDMPFTKAAAVLVTLLYFSFHLLNPVLPVAAGIALGLFYGVGIFAVVVARRTLTIISQHSFLMTLRDANRREELAEANIRLAVLATTDSLTGIANRRSAGNQIAELWTDEAARSAGIAFVMADIDHFKRLNDTRGHAAGDACIREVAHTIVDVIRPECDFASRHGGEEFLVVLTRVSEEEALEIAERVRQTIEQLGIANPQADGGIVTLSIGVAFAYKDAGPELVTKWADDALYEAKRLGRNRICVSARGEPDRRRAPEVARSSAETGYPALRPVAQAS
ncbi:MAG: diguanylate cyclase [Rhizobiaceae bacterium]|nr:diguanylate cyclase [Rhizobiaceae bacterium]